MISIKDGAKIDGLKPEILAGLMIVEKVMSHFGFDTVVTEGTGGEHMVGSLHYTGYALDIRCKHIELPSKKHEIMLEAKAMLGENYDFILENEGKDDQHFHMEYDPK